MTPHSPWDTPRERNGRAAWSEGTNADLSTVGVRHEGRLVASHDRVWARGMTRTDPAHQAAASALRQQFQRPRPAAAPAAGPCDGLHRDLADYDRAFGLTSGE